MKWLIASDIHGSAYYCEKLLEAYKREGADKMLLLGDVLYHGPRNDLPEGYAPKKVIEMLNAMKNEILCVRGNCEAEVDQMVLNFPVLADYAILSVGKRMIFVTHGEFFAIFLSGIFFGLFHGNFSQFFFATMLGMFFAFIYIRTGNVLYTIILHMVINMTSSVVTTILAADYLAAIGDGSKAVLMEALTTNPMPIILYLLWLGFLGIVVFTGLIIFIVSVCKKKYALKPMFAEYKKGKTIQSVMTSWGFVLFLAVTLIIFANVYVLPLFVK